MIVSTFLFSSLRFPYLHFLIFLQRLGVAFEVGTSIAVIFNANKLKASVCEPLCAVQEGHTLATFSVHGTIPVAWSHSALL